MTEIMNAGVLEDTLWAMYSTDVKALARRLGLGGRRAKRDLIPAILDLHAEPSCAIRVREAVDAIDRRKPSRHNPPKAQKNLLPAFDAVAGWPALEVPAVETTAMDVDNDDDPWTSESDDSGGDFQPDGGFFQPESPAMLRFTPVHSPAAVQTCPFL